ncbi:hypothetical protein BO99DRAFT_45283 [Aspergillus violaceofuscus CBS 115571]|uniref:Uncharacterized protein n=1 Tax=Aspergillus violaceofuscus (strain CBS 115571) TaxID=1450538 RepID=A0A2V5GZH9_ASPV1|nr:hypothetical protein BO99DRAFT_45283 [Aspergillus violaceofuscus CBS 115571]
MIGCSAATLGCSHCNYGCSECRPQPAWSTRSSKAKQRKQGRAQAESCRRLHGPATLNLETWQQVTSSLT